MVSPGGLQEEREAVEAVISMVAGGSLDNIT